MDGGESAAMSRIEQLEQVESLSTPNFTEDDAVRPMSEGRFQQLADGHRGESVLLRTSLKAHHVALTNPDFGRVLDYDHALVVRNEVREDVEQRGLTCTRAAADKDVVAFRYGPFKL